MAKGFMFKLWISRGKQRGMKTILATLCCAGTALLNHGEGRAAKIRDRRFDQRHCPFLGKLLFSY